MRFNLPYYLLAPVNFVLAQRQNDSNAFSSRMLRTTSDGNFDSIMNDRALAVTFDSSSPLATYWDFLSCGALPGDDHDAKTGDCPFGAEVILEKPKTNCWYGEFEGFSGEWCTCYKDDPQLPDCCFFSYTMYECIKSSTEPAAFVDFSQGENCPTCTPYVLEGGAQIKLAPGGVKALRIDSDGPRAKIPNININPTYMPECTMTIGVYLESIPADATGWIFGHEESNWDRTIVLHDRRNLTWVEGTNMITSTTGQKVWKPWSDDNLETGTAPTKEWFHVTAVFRQGGESAVYVNGVKSDVTTIGQNDDGLPDLYVGRQGRDDRSNSWSDAWIKEVKVFNAALSDAQVQQESDAFHGSLLSSSPSMSINPSSTPSMTPSPPPIDSPSLPTWSIDDGSVNLDNLSGDAPYVLVTHDVGSADAELQVKLYENDCTTLVTSDAGISISNEDISNQVVSYRVNIAKASVGSSTFLEASGDILKFCVEAALHVPNDTSGWGSIVSKKSLFDIKFDLENATYEVGLTTQGEAPDDIDDIEVDDEFYDVTACICSESFTCDSPVPTLQENSDVFICLIPSTGVSFTDFDVTISKVEDGGSLSFTYDAVAYADGTGQTLPPFSSIEYSGTTIRVRTQLLSGLFDLNAAGSAKISGSGTFLLTNAKEQDEVEGEFGFDIPLAKGGEEAGSMFDCLFNRIAMMMKQEVGSDIFVHTESEE